MTKRSLTLSGLTAGFVAATLIGCGGGAPQKPTVTAKSSKKAEGGGEPASGGNTPDKGDTGGKAPAAGGFGSFTGRVVLKGAAPEQKWIAKKGAGDDVVKDAAICAAEDLPDEKLVVGADGGVANVFIYLQKVPAGAKVAAASEEPVLFDQKFCRFIPHAAVYRVGQTIKVVSDDMVTHNTHNFPNNPDNQSVSNSIKPNDREGFNIVYAGAEKEPLFVKCDIHGFMAAWHLPLAHSYVAVTDKDGKFEIKDIPSGAHEFIVWHEGPKYIERKLKITIEADKATEKELSYEASKFAVNNDHPVRTVILSSRD